jgi:hypothetical protein
MHSAIVAVTMPDRQSGWDEFTSAVATKLKDGPTVRRLGENVWQINFQQTPALLSWLIVLCDRNGLEYEILPLETEPKWLPVASDPKPS